MKLIFIDVDNTLLDFDEYVKTTMKNGFDYFNLIPYEPYMYDIFTTINNNLWRKIETRELTFDELQKIRWNLIFEKLKINFDGVTFEKYFRKELNESAIPVPGSYTLLENLHKQYILCAASNGPYNQQIHRLNLADMTKYFDYFFISEKIGVSKPHKSFFSIALNEVNSDRDNKITPADCMILGDSLTSDIAGGKNFGMTTCLYRRDKSTNIDSTACDIIIDNLTDLIDLIN